MDNFDLKKYLAEGRINQDSQELNEKKQDSKKGNKEEQKRMEGAIRDNRDHIKSLEKDIKADQKKLKKLKADEPKDVNESEVTEDRAASAARGLENIVNFVLKHADKGKDWIEKNVKMGKMADAIGEGEEEVEEGYGKPMYDEDDTKPMKEDERTDAEEEGYEDGFKDAKKDMKDALSKMKISELKAKIREDIISLLNEEEEEEAEVEVEDEVEVDIEEPALDADEAQEGLSADEKEIQDSLKIAYDNAIAIGDKKLADQIGNSITFFTRSHVVER